MKQKIAIIQFILIMVLTLSGCLRSTSVFTESESFIQSQLSGLVADFNEEPIANATVIYNGQSQQTNEFGYFQFDDVQVSNLNNTLMIEKQGYFSGSRTFISDKLETNVQTTILLQKGNFSSFSASSGGKIQDKKVSLDFPSNAIVNELTNTLYSGEVHVFVKHIDPSDPRSFYFMPGNLTGIADGVTPVILESFGMVGVEMESPSGEKLQIAPGMKVEMEAIVPDNKIDLAPQKIDMWHFNNLNGKWENDGEAFWDNGKYIGTVSHFSWWNYDYSAPSIILKGTIVDPLAKPLKNTPIRISSDILDISVQGTTDSKGDFMGEVPKGHELVLEIFTKQCWQTLSASNIGAFTEDTDLGKLEVSIPDDKLTTVNGIALNCNLEPLTTGVVKFNSTLYSLEDGSFDFSFLTCNGVDYSFEVIDLLNLKSSGKIPITSFQNNSLDDINVCSSFENHVSFICEEFEIDDLIVEGLRVEKDFNGHIVILNVGSGAPSTMSLVYDGGSETELLEGTFDMYPLHYVGVVELESSTAFGEITITQGGEFGNCTLIGTYSGITAGIPYDFSGSFHVVSK